MTNRLHFLACVCVLLVSCGSENNRSNPENTSVPIHTQPVPETPVVAEPFPIEIPEPPTPDCRQDLAGTCRHNPPSMGALEVT